MKCWDQRRSETFLGTTGTKQLHLLPPTVSPPAPGMACPWGLAATQGKEWPFLPSSWWPSQAAPQLPVGCHYRLKQRDQADLGKGTETKARLFSYLAMTRAGLKFISSSRQSSLWARIFSDLGSIEMSKNLYQFLLCPLSFNTHGLAERTQAGKLALGLKTPNFSLISHIASGEQVPFPLSASSVRREHYYLFCRVLLSVRGCILGRN